MSKKIQLKVVTPERLILEEVVDQVIIPTTEGELTILPDHIPLVAQLASGDIVGIVLGESIPMAVVGGFVEVNKIDGQTTVAILADFAEHVSELTDEEVAKAKKRAEELMQQKNNAEVVDFEKFEAELERSLNRVKIADKWRTKKYRK